MHYSFKNTLCGLAVLIAAGLSAQQSFAQTVTLETDEDATISLAPINDELPLPEEISLFDEQTDDVSLPAEGLLIPSQPMDNAATDIIPMESGNTPQTEISSNNIAETSAPVQQPVSEIIPQNVNITIEEPSPEPQKNIPQRIVSNTPPAAVAQANTPLLSASNSTGGFDENISPSINNDLFMRMSDLEKQTTLLNLELKKERVQNEIAAVKAQRLRAQEEEEARKQEEERKRIEWENEQERLLIAEQTKLKEAEAQMEKLRQEKIVKAYKATMLNNIQKWINVNADVYKQMAKKDAEIKQIMEDNQNKMKILQQKADDIREKAETARDAHEKKVANLESQISILKTRLEAEIEASKKKLSDAQAQVSSRKNPFATADGTLASLNPNKKLSDEYAIMEITGQGGTLAAKLINSDGDVFLAKVGTTLLNGYTINEIAQTYISAVNKDNQKDYLYFSAGGILDQEPISSDITIKAPAVTQGAAANQEEQGNTRSRSRRINATQGIPSLSQGMFIK